MLFKQVIAKHRRIHFVGVGGIGMSGIAEILLNLGYKISGSDLRGSPITERLSEMGATIFEGHAAENADGADAVVVSTAISADNPEVRRAAARRVPIIPRGELLAELMRLKFGIAIGGSHGKTTTTSMTAAILNSAKMDPTVVVGGRVDAMGSNARLGASDFLLVEADESDGSFLKLAPILAVITTIDREHLDYYGSFDKVKDAFVEFANKTPFYGSAIVSAEDAAIREILPRIERRARTYAISREADLRAHDVECGHLQSRFRLEFQGRDLGEFEVRAPGRHSVLNAMAAVLVAIELDIPADEIRRGLASFSGVDRRFQVRGVEQGVTVIEDYGHHPTEIAATLAAARQCRFKNVHVVFQPHRYSRTQSLQSEFATCFSDCDSLLVTEIYAAGEKPIPGVSAAALADAVEEAGHPGVHYAGSIEEAIEGAAGRAEAGDCVLLLGAGNIGQACPKLLGRLAARGAAAVNG